jgi:hypothetical protein
VVRKGGGLANRNGRRVKSGSWLQAHVVNVKALLPAFFRITLKYQLACLNVLFASRNEGSKKAKDELSVH